MPAASALDAVGLVGLHRLHGRGDAGLFEFQAHIGQILFLLSRAHALELVADGVVDPDILIIHLAHPL